MNLLSVAVCTYNRADRLPRLVQALRSQKCSVPFELLVINNNSTDNTGGVLKELMKSGGAPLRCIKEIRQGIVHARNCAIEHTKNSSYVAFIDDDELPGPDWLEAAADALHREGAECVGGEIRVSLPSEKRPHWLEEELLGFLGEKKQGAEAFWITDRSTPVWSGNIAYRTSIFAEGLRFDVRYNREGPGIGGGEDAIMFDEMLRMGSRVRYRPDMVVDHFVEDWKLRRRYFLSLHFTAGIKYGRFMTGEYERTILGVPPFMFMQAFSQWNRTLKKLLRREPGMLRQAMNGAHGTGMIVGRFQRWKKSCSGTHA
jgi:glycosyltransferase involved in cell wall biosynthesis